MSHKATLCLNRLAVAAAMSLAAMAAQAEDQYLSAAINLSNLSFQLIDLDPNDGIAPSLTILSDANLAVSPVESVLNGFGDETVNTVVPFVSLTGAGSPLTNFSTQSDGLGLSTTANSVSFKTALKNSDLVSKANVVDTFTVENGRELITYTYTSDNSGGGKEGVLSLPGIRQTDWNEPAVYSAKLSANTALIITGQATADVHVDRTMLEAAYLQLQAGYENPDLGTAIDAYSSVRASVALNLYAAGNQGTYGEGSAISLDSYSSSSFYMSADTGINGLNGIQVNDTNTGLPTFLDTNTHDINKQSSFSLVSFNNTGQDINLSLDFQAQVTAIQLVQRTSATVTYTDNPNYQPPELPPLPTPDPSIPSIPEPSTYALMGLGLVGIVLARRRLRPTQAA